MNNIQVGSKLDL